MATFVRAGEDDTQEDYVNLSEVRTTLPERSPEETPTSGRRLYRLAAVCFGLMCLVQVILNNSLFQAWRHSFETRYQNLTEHRDQLQTSYNNLTDERDQLETSYNNVTDERDWLQRGNDDLRRRISQVMSRLCRCINTETRRIGRLIEKIELLPANSFCKSIEIIATLKETGQEICLDPNAPWVKKVIERILTASN